jgi:hypothetical protein
MSIRKGYKACINIFSGFIVSINFVATAAILTSFRQWDQWQKTKTGIKMTFFICLIGMC